MNVWATIGAHGACIKAFATAVEPMHINWFSLQFKQHAYLVTLSFRVEILPKK